MGGEDSSCVCNTGSSGFRWLCLARSALALVVTVLAAVVLVNGLRLVLQPGTTIELNIAQSDMFVQRYEYVDGTSTYSFRFYLEANNPSKVVFIRFDNITVKLYDTSPPKEESLLAEFDLDPPLLSLSQMEEQEYFVHSSYVANATSTHAEDKLYRVAIATTDDHDVEGAVMMLSGKLSVSNYTKPGTVSLKRYTKLAQPSSGNFKVYCIKM